MLILLDVAAGRIRGWTVAWLTMLSVTYLAGEPSANTLRQPWLDFLRNSLPVEVFLISVVVAIVSTTRRRYSDLLPVCALLLIAIVAWHPVGLSPATWIWQLALVPFGLVLAAGPLWGQIKASTARSEPAQPKTEPNDIPNAAPPPSSRTVGA
jgi:hypothetical protein